VIIYYLQNRLLDVGTTIHNNPFPYTLYRNKGMSTKTTAAAVRHDPQVQRICEFIKEERINAARTKAVEIEAKEPRAFPHHPPGRQ
jgi:hypothetical protein